MQILIKYNKVLFILLFYIINFLLMLYYIIEGNINLSLIILLFTKILLQ
jgi:hypothetical protein